MKGPAAGRCTGHCCRGFTLDLDYVTDPEASFQDDAFIRDMLVPIEPDLDDGREHAWKFDCRHHDGRNCTRYADRPKMCRDYPYGKACGRAGCTLAGLGETRGWVWLEAEQDWVMTA